MKLISKIFFAIGLLFLSVIVLFLALIVLLPRSQPDDSISTKQIEERFQDHREDFELVMAYFSQPELRFSTTARHLRRGRRRVYTHEGEDSPFVRVSDRETERALRRLFLQGGMDGVTRDGNEIRFQLWRWSGQSAGLIYSINGETPSGRPSLPTTLTEFVPLEESGWYFYFRDPNR